jgi:NAD(P)-dependent dehydrogenase (short-subunit alcohol dehydrogenase family)
LKTIKQLISMKDRTALITGAAGGLGVHIAETILELGGYVVMVDYPGSDYEIVNEKLNQYKKNILFLDCDLESSDDRAKLVEKVTSNDLTLNVLINNAAFVGTNNLKGWVTDFEEQSLDTWRRALEINLTTCFDLSKNFSHMLKISGSGSIINIASIYGINGPDHSLYTGTEMGNPAAYAASKGGLIQLTRWLSTSLAPEIRVNAISPGGIFRNQPKKFVNRYEARTPLRRMATEEDLKGIVAYLASDLSAYVTGQNIVIDGGWTTW